MLNAKKILLGVSGSIAAYKTVHLVRLLKKEGAEVKVIVTQSAQDFVTKKALATVSENPVIDNFYQDENPELWNNHVKLGMWADIMLIAPASANTIAKLNSAEANNILITTFLSARCPVFVAPAMDLDMWTHPSNQVNIQGLKEKNIHIIEPASGSLASGLEGKGRMPEPEELLSTITHFLKSQSPLSGVEALVTAGPTYENIDPVRFIGNYSSGKMGYALANALVKLGASVHLVSGPSALKQPKGLKSFVKITSALEMLEACENKASTVDLAFFAAAVSDYRPKAVATSKLKKGIDTLNTIELVENPDILKKLCATKKENQTFIGFALETDNVIENAKAKRIKKGCDYIIANSPNAKDTGFSHDTNLVTLIGETLNKDLPLMSKDLLAVEIITQLMPLLKHVK